MKTKFSTAIFIAAASFIMIQSCKKDSKNEIGNGSENNETKISAQGGGSSHNMGQNCMSCHKQGGSGEGWFSAAGTVYDSLLTSAYPNAVVKLYTGPDGTGTLKKTIQADAKGNFFTTEAIDFGTGLYPSVSGGSITKYMSSAITAGQCNGCHGVSTDKIWIK